MRKHFLILMLLTLLPLAGWAVDLVKVTPYNISKYYGQPDEGITLIFSEDQGLTGKNASVLRAGLYISRNGVNAGEAVGDYTYTLGFDPDNISAAKKTQYDINDEDIATFVSAHTVAVQGSATLSIRKMPLNNADVVLTAIPDQEKTGSAIDPDMILTNTKNHEVLVKGVDYTVEWENNTNGPTATGTLTAKGPNYSGMRTGVTFKIKQSIADAVIVLAGHTGKVYNGESQTPSSITVTVGGVLLNDGNTDDYEVEYTNSNTGDVNPTTNAGTVTVTIKAKTGSSYSGTATTTYQIAPKSVGDTFTFTVNNSGNFEYTGSVATPTISTVKAGALDITADDYEISTENINRGAATATVTLKRNFTGSKTFNYTITPKAITAPTLTLAQEEGATTLDHYVYAKADIKPAVTVLSGTATLAETDYVIAYKDNDDESDEEDLKSVGQKKVVVSATATGNYTFTAAEKTYTIDKRKLTIKANDLVVGVGADLNPVATISNLAVTPSSIDLKVADGKNAELNGTIKFTYKDADNNEVTPADADTYTIIPELVADDEEALNANYDYTTIVNGTLTITRSNIIVKVDARTMTYGGAAPTFAISHVSGLSQSQRTGDNFANIIGTIDQKKFSYWVKDANDNDVANPDMKNAGSYSVSYNGGFIQNGNYTITVEPGTLTVEPKPITFDMIQDIASVTYTGSTLAPVVTIKDGDVTIPASEYTLQFPQLVKAGNYDVTITDNEGGNYTIYRNAGTSQRPNYVNYWKKGYTILGKTLRVTADEATWKYGTAQNFTYKINRDDLVEDDKPKTEAELGINGIKVNIVTTKTVGEHAEGLKPAGAATYGNYTMSYQPGKLTITKGTIVAKVKNTTIQYGDAADANTFHLEAVSGMEESEKANFDDIVKYDHEVAKFTYDAESMATVNMDGYTINYNGATPTATNYDITVVTDGLLKVAPRKITVKSLNQTVDLIAVPAQAFDPVPSITPAASPTVAITAGNLVNGHTIADIIEKLTAETSIDAQATNVINIVLKENPLYDVTIDTEHAGKLTISNGVSITLGNDEITDLATIATYAASAYQVDVTMNFAKRKGRTFGTYGLGANWIAENWATMVLPFDITVADLSKALGYGIVNVIDPDGYKTDANGDPVFKFKLTMKGGNGSTEVLKANRPFVIKLAEDVKTENVKFGSRKIVAATDDDVLEAGGGNTFVGTYTTKTVTGTENYSFWFLLGDYADWAYINAGAKLSWNIVPFEAYINTADGSAARQATFIMEELDGNTTEIKTVNVDNKNGVNVEGLYNLNGVKLNSLPAQKGVYIQNGKKIVVK